MQRPVFLSKFLPDIFCSSFEEEKLYFKKKFFEYLQREDIVNNSVLQGAVFKQFYKYFQFVYGFNREEREYVISYLLEMFFNAEFARTESKTQILIALHNFLDLEKPLKHLRLDWKVFYSYINKYFMSNQTSAIINEGSQAQLME